MDKKRLGAIVLLAGVLVLVGAGVASAADLQNGPVTVSCSGSVTWHIVHNQTGGVSTGTLTAIFATAGTKTVSNGAPFEAAVLHYWVTTPAGDTLQSASDNVAGGHLVFSHSTCETTTTDPSTSTTTTSTTTTSTTTTSTSTTSTTVPGETTTTSTTVPGSTTLGTSTTTTQATTTSEETAGPGTLPYTGGPIDGGAFPNFYLALVVVGAVLVLSGAGILAKSYWTE